MLEQRSSEGDVLSENRATLNWSRGSNAFPHETYSRDPVWGFVGGIDVLSARPRDALR